MYWVLWSYDPITEDDAVDLVEQRGYIDHVIYDFDCVFQDVGYRCSWTSECRDDIIKECE
jgi:hypothetical protein